jgi:hypothetical protein
MMNDERFKRTVAVLSALIAVLAAVVALAQNDASARSDLAGRDARVYAMQALGQKVSGDARTNYDYNSAYQTWYELDLLASSAEARGDELAAQRYLTLRDQVPSLSPMLAAPYFTPELGEVDHARYEAEVYLVEITALTERFSAASSVKDAWSAKSGTYIIHLTLLAVALFLFGPSTIATPRTRWICRHGRVHHAYVSLWARSPDAAGVRSARPAWSDRAYAEGGLAHQSRWSEPGGTYRALQAVPDYTNALAARADARLAEQYLKPSPTTSARVRRQPREHRRQPGLDHTCKAVSTTPGARTARAAAGSEILDSLRS